MLKTRTKPVINEDQITRKVSSATADKAIRSEASAHVRRCIKVTPPVINEYLCGSGYSNAKLLLDCAKSDIEGLVNFKLCVAESTGEIVDVKQAEEDPYEEYLFNGEAVLKLIDNIDFHKRLEQRLHVLGKVMLGKKESFNLNQEGKGVPFIGDWFIETSASEEYVRERLVEKMNSGAFKKCIVDLNLVNSFGTEEAIKDHLRYLVVENLVVLPSSLRLSQKNQNNPLTEMYLRVYRLSNECENFRDASSIQQFVWHYQKLHATINSIFEKESDIVNNNDKVLKNLKSVKDTIGGKHGLIRGTNLAKRQDYSARAVVVINPFIPIDHIGLPKSMVPKMYRYYENRYIQSKDLPKLLANSSTNTMTDEILKLLKRNSVEDSLPILMGRNPTLHKHGIQGFYVTFVDGDAIEVSPLVCPAFNMDFDGDTAHVEIPITEGACREVANLILTDRNLLLAKTGECTICPRMDILYGLYNCTKASVYGNPVAVFNTGEDVREAVLSQEVTVDTVVTAMDMRVTDTAGKIAFMSCFPAGFLKEVATVTSSSIKEVVNRLSEEHYMVFTDTINKLVELGFKTAYIYASTVSLLRDLKDIEEYDNCFEVFHKEMEPINKLNDIGFYTASSYSLEYGQKFERAMKMKEKYVYDKIGEDSMFWQMSKSGARGNKSNLLQMYAAKGRIRKSGGETINVAIENCYVTQLTPMEHFIAAVGAREGQIAKSIKTADTGYLERQLRHSTGSIKITCKDCGTKHGIVLKKSDIYAYLADSTSTEEERKQAEKDTINDFTFYIANRYEAGTDRLITPELARQLAEDPKVKSVTIRSPLKCNNPCCAKCYGYDVSTRHEVVVGTAVGVIAAQSVGEMLTQTTLKSFQSGGVAGKADMMSDFERISKLVHCSNIYTAYINGNYSTYEPVAWATGDVTLTSKNGVMSEISISGDKKKLTVGSNMQVLSKVEKGQPMFSKRKDLNISEAMKYAGLDFTEVYIVNTLYRLFATNAKLNIKHFELIVCGMIGYIPVVSDIPELKIGLRYTVSQLVELGYDYSNTSFVPVINSVKDAVLKSVNFMEGLILEDQKAVLADAMMYGLGDTVSDVYVQMALGLHIKVGTGYNKNFMEEMNAVR